MAIDDILRECIGFEWDQGNLLKNWERHGVSASECEQVFFNRPLVALPDVAHSGDESRFYALGQTDAARHMFIVFTVRNNLIQVISARDMNRKERKALERYEEDSEIQRGE